MRIAGAVILVVALVVPAGARVKAIDTAEYEFRTRSSYEELLYAFGRGDSVSVRSAAERVSVEQPATAAAADAALLLALSENDPQDSRARLRKVCDEYPGTLWEREALLAQARLHLFWNDPRSALERIEEASRVAATPVEDSVVVIDPFEVAERLASLYLHVGRARDAGPMLASLAPDSLPLEERVRVQYLSAVHASKTGRPEEAVRLINDILVRYPGADLVGDAEAFLSGISRFDLPARNLGEIPDTLPLD